MATSGGLRDRARRAMRAEVSALGLALFVERGFDNTTVDDLAQAAGMSRTSFFRYFATKEDVVLGHLEELGQQIADALAERPEDEHPWDSLRSAFSVAFEIATESPEQALLLGRMLLETPSLKARHHEKQSRWQELLVPEVTRRLGDADELRAAALIAAALACLDVAHQAWAASDGAVSLPELVGRAMDAVRQ